MRDNRLTGLDLLRAVACLLVFAHHTTQRLHLDALSGGWRQYYNFFNMGAFGVGIFFLLSGFLLARPFWIAFDAGTPMPSLKVFALRRAARIMPGFYASILVTFVLELTVFGTRLDLQLVHRLAMGLFFISEFHPFSLFPVDLNGPLWSIGMEAASYVLLPVGLVALFALRETLPGWRGRAVFVAVVLVALLVHCVIVAVFPQHRAEDGLASYWMPRFNPVGFFVVFALGSLTAGLSLLYRGPRSAIADLLVCCGLGVAIYAMWSVGPARAPESFGWFGLPYDFPFFHAGIALALLAFPHTRLLPLISEAPPIAYIAKISFGIYIWHFLILELLRQNFAPNFTYDGMTDTAAWLLLTAISLLLALGAGSLSWFLIEQPALNWAKTHEPRQNAATQKLHS